MLYQELRDADLLPSAGPHAHRSEGVRWPWTRRQRADVLLLLFARAWRRSLGTWVASESPVGTVWALPAGHMPGFARRWRDVASCITTARFSSSAFSGAL